MAIVSFQPSHVDGFRALVSETLREFGFAPDPELDADLDDPAATYAALWVAVDGDAVVGSVALRDLGTVAEVAQGHRADHGIAVDRNPQGCVGRGRVVEVRVQLRVGREAELPQRLGHERAKAVDVARLERHDRHAAPSLVTAGCVPRAGTRRSSGS